MKSSHVLSLFVTVFVCAMMTLDFAEAANKTCNFLFIDLQKPNGNCQKPVPIIPPTPPSIMALPPIDQCPKRIRLSWLQSPPFVFKTNKEDAQPSGVFVDLLHSSLSACCRLEGSDPPDMSYDARPAINLESLYMKMYSQETDIILPVNNITVHYLGNRYQKVGVLYSPGDALLINKSFRYNQDKDDAWESLIKVVPILLLSILLAAIAGICVWALDTKRNPRDFPRPFTQGASEGFWWAFVTMITVGYGDRTPKSFLARIIGIVWIVTSLAVCSIMTASITAALTSINVDKHIDIADKNLAVLKDSTSITNAVWNDANPILFNDFDSMYNALNKGHVDGILMEMYAASYAIKEKGDDNLKLAKLYIKWNYLSFVIANRHAFPINAQKCLEKIFKLHNNDVSMIVKRFSQDAKKKSRLKKSKKHEMVSLVSFDSPGLIIIIGCFLLLSLCGAVDQVYRARRQRKYNIEMKESKKVDSKSLEIRKQVFKIEDLSPAKEGN